ncbi:MAG: hypothetical protein LBJ36_06070 [Synergistaceae bacterium]|jgi:hypothetical protein|nr:hypothetical protein [Synergistaceae bacterium]
MGFNFILMEWHRGNAKDRSLLLLIFTPMFICMLGLVLSFAGFVFAFISRLLGWFLLTALFGGGGIICYEKLREHQLFSPSPSSSSSFSSQTVFSTDATTTENSSQSNKRSTTDEAGEGSGEKTRRKKWFEGIRR